MTTPVLAGHVHLAMAVPELVPPELPNFQAI
jgi:hypothetical protein